MIDFTPKDRYTFDDLVEIMVVLRNECPWDREQTHKSIRRDLIEETYEVIEGIDTDDPVILREELGDLLLQVVFHARIEEERGNFDLSDVCDELSKKLIHRHPHIFLEGEKTDTKTSQQVLERWEAIKRADKGGHVKSVESVAKSLPSLLRADKLYSRAAKAGFGQDETEVWEAVQNKMQQLKTSDGDTVELLGDMLFAMCGVARSMGIDPERALELSCERFSKSFVDENGIKPTEYMSK